MSAKQELLNFILSNEFVTKPSLIDKFESLVNNLEKECLNKNIKTCDCPACGLIFNPNGND